MSAAFPNSTARQPVLRQNPRQRILYLTFPHLPADRMARIRWGASWLSKGRPDHPPVVFADRVKNAMRLVALDGCARKAGLKLGQGAAEARAMYPGIDILPSEPAADHAFLETLADWCDRYTPLVALDGSAGLFLDISGCTHLHGGERSLREDLLSRLFKLGVEARAAISSAPGLSWAMARFGTATIIADEEAEDALARLPLAALRLSHETVATLARVGLKRIGDILNAPRAPLARRFGPDVLLRLDQALGLEDEPLSPRLPVASLSAERRLAAPVQGEDDILGLALRLAASLKSDLERRGEGGRLFELLLFRVDGRVFRIQAATSSPLRDPERIAALFRERLQAVHDDLDAGFGFEILRLNIVKTDAYQLLQTDFSGTPDQDRSLAAFADRVVARFGKDSLSVPVFAESHLPERAVRFRPVEDIAFLSSPVLSPVLASVPVRPSVRPLRLFTHPEPVMAIAAEIPEGAPQSFHWRKTLYQVKHAEGPERIAGEWWIDGETARTRDYFRVEDEAGHRFWLYRDGLYGTESENPRWFLQGIFA